MTARIGPGHTRKLLLVGWAGADWGLLTPQLDRGEMPALDALIARGTMARLSGLGPSLSPLVWTSIATGKRADKHGVLSATEPDAATGLQEPISARARQASALWEILDRESKAAHAIGWPASRPASASATRGVVVSDRFARAVNPIGEPWPIEPDDVSPDRVTSRLAELRIHPGDLCAATGPPVPAQAGRGRPGLRPSPRGDRGVPGRGGDHSRGGDLGPGARALGLPRRPLCRPGDDSATSSSVTPRRGRRAYPSGMVTFTARSSRPAIASSTRCWPGSSSWPATTRR